MKKYTRKEKMRLAYDAIELASLNDTDLEMQERGDIAMDKYLARTLTKEEIEYWSNRRIEFNSMKEW